MINILKKLRDEINFNRAVIYQLTEYALDLKEVPEKEILAVLKKKDLKKLRELIKKRPSYTELKTKAREKGLTNYSRMHSDEIHKKLNNGENNGKN